MKKLFLIISLIALCFTVGCEGAKTGGDVVSPGMTDPYIIDAVLCVSIEDGKPVSITNLFLLGERINLWIHWANVKTGQTIKTTWHDPSNKQVGESNIIFQAREDRQISISYIDLNKTSTVTGEWLVKVFLDGVFMRSYLFTISE